jgi:hypothetical protein
VKKSKHLLQIRELSYEVLLYSKSIDTNSKRDKNEVKMRRLRCEHLILVSLAIHREDMLLKVSLKWDIHFEQCLKLVLV